MRWMLRVRNIEWNNLRSKLCRVSVSAPGKISLLQSWLGSPDEISLTKEEEKGEEEEEKKNSVTWTVYLYIT